MSGLSASPNPACTCVLPDLQFLFLKASARTEPSKGREGEMQIMQMFKLSLNHISKEPFLCLSMLLLEAYPFLRIL